MIAANVSVARRDSRERLAQSKGKKMTKLFLIGIVALSSCQAPLRTAVAQQTRAYDAQGRSLGTAVPQGESSTRFYDARGNSLGTSTTTGNTTRFYNERGQPTSTTTINRR